MISGAATAAVFHPIDSLRIRIFYKQNASWLSLMDGFGFNVTTTLIKGVISYPLRDTFKNKLLLHNFSEVNSSILSSVGSGIVLGLFSTPINVIKVPLQAGHHSKMNNVIKHIYRERGLIGFMNGGVATLMRDTVWTMTYFPLYEFILKNYTENKLSASLAAGSLAMNFAYPFDGIRLYRQHGKVNYNFWHGFFVALRWNKPNLKSFGIAMIRVPAATSFMHMFYLYLNGQLR